MMLVDVDGRFVEKVMARECRKYGWSYRLQELKYTKAGPFLILDYGQNYTKVI